MNEVVLSERQWIGGGRRRKEKSGWPRRLAGTM
jgi:hypothetical protein